MAIDEGRAVPGIRHLSGELVFATAMYESGDWESAPLVSTNLIDSVARYTTIRVAPKGVNVSLGSEQLFEYPFVWLTGHLPVRFTDAERENLVRFIERGGFLVVDDHNHDIDGVFHKTATEELKRAFGEGSLIELPNDHEIYRCFFEFENGPPNTTHELNGWGDNLLHEHLYAVIQNRRIGVLYSSKDYSSEWNFHPDTKRFMGVDPTRFGVNMIVYALTR